MILLGFHLNQMKTQEELTKLEIILKELNEKYEDSDILTFTDLNVDANSTKFEKLKKKSSSITSTFQTLQNQLKRDKGSDRWTLVYISTL